MFEDCQTVFHSSKTFLHSYQQYARVLIFCTSSPTLLVTLLFVFIAILVDIKWFLVVVLICISLRTNDVEHLLMCHWPSVYLLVKKCLFKSFAYLRIGLVLLLSFSCSSYVLLNPHCQRPQSLGLDYNSQVKLIQVFSAMLLKIVLASSTHARIQKPPSQF